VAFEFETPELAPSARCTIDGEHPLQPATPAPGSPFLTADEAAALLRVSRWVVYRALEAGRIPGARRIGKEWRIMRSALLDSSSWAEARVMRKPRKRKSA
jgi:excisionase family DNA binding protein